jgi:TatD DNase family protein
MLIDTHCHLDAVEFAGDRDAVAQAAQDAGVGMIIVPAVEKNNFSDVRDCCRRYRGCFPAYGMHPLYLGRAGDGDLLFLREWVTQELAGPNPPVAIGEIGLDFYVPGHDAALQEHFFMAQLNLARDLDLPVLLHVRRAVDQVLKCLRRVRVKGGIAHAFNGSVQQAEEMIRLGFKLGFGGAMTYPGSKRIRQLASILPLEAIVLESDAPDMPAVWLSGGRNAPAQLLPIAQVLADLRALPMQQVMLTTTRNAGQIFGDLI